MSTQMQKAREGKISASKQPATEYRGAGKPAERKLNTSTREPDSDNADVGKIIDNAKGRLPNFGGFP